MLPLRDHLPTRTFALVNYLLIALNVGAFLAEFWLTSTGAIPADSALRWALVPARLFRHPLASAPTLITHMFVHGGLAHLAGNMLFLWIFGDNVEDALGHLRYLLFYLACGVAGALAQVALTRYTTLPMVGASGAIAGVLAAYLVLYPRSPITIVNPIPILWLFWGLFLFIPAWLVIVEFFVMNLWMALQPARGPGGVAFVAHLGGFLSGLLLQVALRPRPVRYDRWDRWVTRR